ncbi:MAG: PrsW family glutamic-type intramembrane protease [Candidatus Aminicenantaceae bacterium]
MKIGNILRTGLVNSLFQIGFLIVMFAVGHTTALEFSPSLRFIILTLIILVPSIIWALFFYLQDRYEPEPVSYILASFTAGMAAASLGAIPLYQIIFRVKEWIYASTPLFILGSFFIKASVASILLYAVLRYGFYPLKEFDSPPDGMVYGAIVGTGFAFVNSLHYLWLHPSFTIFTIAFTASVNILVYSAVGSLIGYTLGNSKFRRKNIDFSSFCAVSVGLLSLGVYHILSEFVFVSGIHHAFWLCFILTLIYSFIILGFCYLKIQKITKKYISVEIQPAPKFDFLTTLFIVILLCVSGVISHQGLLGKKFISTEQGFSFRYPHSLSPFSLERISQPLIAINNMFKILFSGENSSPPYTFSAKVEKRDDYEKGLDPLRHVESRQTESFLVEDITVGEKRGKRIVYSYLQREFDFKSGFPKLIKIFTDIIPVGTHVIIFTYKAESSHFEAGLKQYNKILTSLRWKD